MTVTSRRWSFGSQLKRHNMADEMFTSIHKAVKGLPQRCNRCGDIAVLHGTNLCDDCSKILPRNRRCVGCGIDAGKMMMSASLGPSCPDCYDTLSG